MPLPRVVLVLGKGGVGRSSVSAGLALALASRRERVLVLEWTVSDPIGPWFGAEPAGVQPRVIAPGVSVANYELEEALRAYFVDHLGLGLFYRRVVHGRQLQRLIRATPGIAEMLFLGQIWWLTTLAEREAGLAFDRIVVDAPATGHGASLLDLPAMLAGLGAQGLLHLEIARVQSMIADPAWTGALVVTLPEELAADETLDLVPLVRARLGRPPLAVLINRSVLPWAGPGGEGISEEGLAGAVSPEARAGLAVVASELRSRATVEARLRQRLAELPVRALPEQLVAQEHPVPQDVARALARELQRFLEERP